MNAVPNPETLFIEGVFDINAAHVPKILFLIVK